MAPRAGLSKFRCWFLLLAVAVCTGGVGSTHAVEQELSGTIRYTGAKGGQVSDSRPILIALSNRRQHHLRRRRCVNMPRVSNTNAFAAAPSTRSSLR